jgi:hypothetical protein
LIAEENCSELVRLGKSARRDGKVGRKTVAEILFCLLNLCSDDPDHEKPEAPPEQTP